MSGATRVASYSVFAGTVGQGVWRSPDSGASWRRVAYARPNPIVDLEQQVRAVAVDPRNPLRVYIGDECGLLRSQDGGSKWERLHGPFDGLCVWSLAIDPVEPNVIVAGTRPPHFYRSTDGGETWVESSNRLPDTCEIGVPRVTCILFDPTQHQRVWASLELGGIYRSLDQGLNWTRVQSGLPALESRADVHWLSIARGSALRPVGNRVQVVPGHEAVLLVTEQDGLFACSGNGERWYQLATREELPFPYLRCLVAKQDESQTLFLGVSDQPIGSTGAILRSQDGGAHWQVLPMPVKPNSGFFQIATHSADPDFLWAATVMGELYWSENGGDTWNKAERELTEIRTLGWTPNLPAKAL